MTLRIPLFAAILVASTAGLSAPAQAHISIDNAETKGGSFKAVFNVPHGCDGSATTAISITIPEGVIGVKPIPKPGWTVSTVKGAYAKTYDHFHGRKVSEGVMTVTWSGGKLLNEHVDEFVLSVFVTSDFAPGATAYFPVEQVCEKGTLAWTEIPAAGQDAHDLKSPAPGIRVLAKVAGAAPSAIKVGALTIEAPWLRATPGGATVGAGYLRITNTGPQSDRLEGVAFEIAGRSEIHEMKMEGDVMKMRELPGGLEIKPGETIALVAGGTHMMLIDLKVPIAPGAPVAGELTFAKAGKVTVEFSVTPVSGTPAAASKHSHH